MAYVYKAHAKRWARIWKRMGVLSYMESMEMAETDMPFDGNRMLFGGFKPFAV